MLHFSLAPFFSLAITDTLYVWLTRPGANSIKYGRNKQKAICFMNFYIRRNSFTLAYFYLFLIPNEYFIFKRNNSFSELLSIPRSALYKLINICIYVVKEVIPKFLNYSDILCFNMTKHFV